ncbi:type VI secretion system protein TssA [Cohaesibacter marisflavi]|uniref:type VI secretion system protein TssA n=1 Tax=Cohaesibacter marisflavi TaxID=655353 RepID=UPI0029C62854|nr:type VI secretion system protein TssA [Cohaesibacter marisflavi]
MLDLDELLRSFGDDAPSGMDLEYNPDYIALTLANEPGEERVVGDAFIPAEDPDFSEVEKAAKELLARTRDIRVAVMLANASLRTGGLLSFEPVLEYIRRSLSDYWDSVHPQLDEEDDNDPTMRVNAVMGLTDRESLLASLRMVPLAESRTFGLFSLRDLQIAQGEISAPSDMDSVPTPQTISAAFQDTDASHIEALVAAVTACLEHVTAISSEFDEQIGTLGPDLDPLKEILSLMKKQIEAYTGTVLSPNNAEMGDEGDLNGHEISSDAPASAASAASTAASGAIHSPEDVRRAIDRIIDYYARHEPSSPVPLLLSRARRLISADFFTIMQDMAPQGVENVSLIGGIEENDE